MTERDLIECVGEPAALALCRERGGTKWFVPKGVTSGLAKIMGTAAAKRLVATFGGDATYIPRGRALVLTPTQVKFRRLQNEGKSTTEIALLMDVSERSVRKWRAALRKEQQAANAATHTSAGA